MLHLFSDRYHVYRIGGEEFAIIFESANQEEMANAVDLLRREFSALEFSVGGEAAVNCTLSAGYDSRLPDETVLSLFKRVDDALYQAKRSGRNRICAAENFCSIVKDESVSTIA